MKRFSFSVRDSLFMIVVLTITTCLSFIIHLGFSLNDNNVIALNILSVMIVAAGTSGYVYGVFSALFYILTINIYFTYPYGKMDFALDGYPLTFLVMFAIALITSALMTKLKQHAYQAYVNERKTKELLDLQHTIQLESEREKLRANLLRAISHDLRTPLTAILGSASALLDANEVDKNMIEQLAYSIKEESNWLIHMVENLLTITKINNGSNILNKTEELVEEVVAEACSRIRSCYSFAQLTVVVPKEPVLLPMDFILIEQVLFNLIENSIKYAKADGKVEITVGTLLNIVYFEVRDHGVGIDEQLFERLFIRPIDTEKVDGKKGMGIGLNICYSILLSHKGEIKACNALDGGAVFTFYLPIEDTSVSHT